MNLASLLDTTSTARKVALSLGVALAVLVLCLACAWGGYRHGHSTAKDKGDAQYTRLVAAQVNANRLASDTARRIVDAEVIRRDKLVKELATAHAAIEAVSLTITDRRISDASHSVAAADGRCTFGAEWVGLYNESWGFGDGDPAGSAAAPGADGEARGVPTAQGRSLPGGPVTPEDIQAVNRHNARVCLNIKASYLKLVTWAEGLPKTANATEGQ